MGQSQGTAQRSRRSDKSSNVGQKPTGLRFATRIIKSLFVSEGGKICGIGAELGIIGATRRESRKLWESGGSATRNRKYLKNSHGSERERERDEGRATGWRPEDEEGGPRKFSPERNANRYGTSIHPVRGVFPFSLFVRFIVCRSLFDFHPPIGHRHSLAVRRNSVCQHVFYNFN